MLLDSISLGERVGWLKGENVGYLRILRPFSSRFSFVGARVGAAEGTRLEVRVHEPSEGEYIFWMRKYLLPTYSVI